ncbi:MAG: UDP-N-acetyl-D-mannosamine dehydrogenase [Rickettsiaceae bacterium]|jgi:UDP-N-acetyl-D-mannosaminuronic acid dehydrogenase|nr:UDP-N-acetyl-D-mannosamine dehydrogenase [Rickettsiaceae bacterium]
MIFNMSQKVCVMGLGYVGLPLTCLIASSGYNVIGVDTNNYLINEIALGRLPFYEPNLADLMRSSITNSKLQVGKSPSESNIFIIAVPTPLDQENKPDLSFIEAAIEAIIPYIKPNNLIIIESTCPIGTTEKISRQVNAACSDVYIAYCPERILPGNILYEMIYNDRVIGGIDQISSILAENFYKSFIKGKIYTTDSRTAEATKIAENSYRDINIAFANELSLICDQLGIDTNKLIKLANNHPRVNILSPGPGVGGHCIPITPWFLVSAAPNLAILTASARKVNKDKTLWVIRNIRKYMNENRLKTVACFGLTYKPDSSDLRESPALHITQELEKEFEVFRVDPYVEETVSIPRALKEAEIIVGLVAHKIFKDIAQECLAGRHILDFAQVFS